MAAEDGFRGVPVPAGRLVRLAGLGGFAAGTVGRALMAGAREVASGRSPALPDLILTPGNAERLARQLAGMRGAAMKLGQLLSMDAGEVLPPDLAAALARLREGAEAMPPAQLGRVLEGHWGPGWQRHFRRFEVRPVASASIGQVHRAETADGRVLAIKVQHPGVRRAIDSDVANLGAMLRLSGMLPPGLDLGAVMAEVRAQLHAEADYRAEAAHLARFGALLAGAPGLMVPAPVPEWSGDAVLAMDWAPGEPVEGLAGAPQAVRDGVVARLVGLSLREIFDFGLIQSDPNFANFRYQPGTDRVVLLDFGATVTVRPDLAAGMRAMLRAMRADDRAGQRAAALDLGYLAPDTPESAAGVVRDLIAEAGAILRQPELWPARDVLLAALRDRAMALGTSQPALPVPPFDLLLIHRKLGGLYLLAKRLDARIDLGAALRRYD